MPRPLCPRCSREYVRRVSRVGLGERLISLFYVYPFRCQLCGHRFQLLQWGVKYKRIEEDRREYERMPVNFPVTFDAGARPGPRVDRGYFDGRVHIPHGSPTRGGKHFADETGGPGTRLLPSVWKRSSFEVSGQVAWVWNFVQFENGERERLQRFIRGLLLDRWS